MMLDSARAIMTPSARSDVPPFMVMDVMAAAARIEAAGGRVVHMEVGQPAVGAPGPAIAAVRAALGKSALGYTESLGIPSLRARIARHYAESYGLPVSADRVIVTTGSSAGFILAFLSMFEAGDRIAIANPGYPPYRHILTALGCEPVLIETNAATRFAITGESLRAAHRKKPLAGVLVASPANPTGTMMTPDALAALIRVADDEGIRFISDEIYHGLDYAMPVETAARLSENAVVITNAGIDRGRNAIARSLENMTKLLGEAVPVVHSETVIALDNTISIAQVVFSVSSPRVEVTDGVDTYVIKDGQIHAQTVHVRPVFHNDL